MVAVCGFRHGEPTEEKPFTSLRRKSGRFGKDFADDQGDRGGDGDGDDGDGDDHGECGETKQHVLLLIITGLVKTAFI